MKIVSYLRDDDSDEYLSGIDVFLIDASGKNIGKIATSNSEGMISFESDLLKPGYKVQAGDTTIDYAASANNTVYIKPIINTGTNDSAKTTAKPNYILPISLASASLICLIIFAIKATA